IDQRQHVGEKRFHLPPFILEFPEISQAEPPGTYVIVKYSYSDTFLLLLKQCVIEFSSEIVQFENIVLEMDVVFCIAYIGKQTVEFIPSISERRYGIIEWQKRLVVMQEQVKRFLL